MAFTLPTALFDQSTGQRLLLPVPLINQSVLSSAGFIELPVPLFNQSAVPGMFLPRPVFDQTAPPAVRGPDLPVPLINQSAIVSLKLPIPLINNPTDLIVTILPGITAEITIPAVTHIAAPLPGIGVSATTLVTLFASIDSNLPVIGTTIAAGRSFIEAKLPLLGNSADVIVGTMASIDARLPPVISTGTTSAAGVIIIDGVVPSVGGDITGRAGIFITIPAATIPAVIPDITTLAGLVAEIVANIPPPISEQYGYYGVDVVIDSEFSILQSFIDAGLPDSALRQIATLVMNSKTYVISEYTNYPFNSFAKFKGVTLGASSKGLFTLDTQAKDDDANIDSKFALGKHDFGTEHVKVMERLYVGAKIGDAMSIKITADEKEPTEYDLETEGETAVMNRRVKLGRGERGRYWQLEVANKNGADFEIDAIDFGVRVLGRRV